MQEIIQRDLFKTLKEESKNSKITALIGSRQVGKTTALKYVLSESESSKYLSFDDITLLRLFTGNPALFYEQHIKPHKVVVIDEFQYAPEGGKVLKFIYDQLLDGQKIFISGSSGPDISIESIQYLVGRISILEAFPLSFREFIGYREPSMQVLFKKERKVSDFEQMMPLFDDYLIYGGYPGVVVSPNREKELANLVNTYLLKEIRQVLNYKNHFEFDLLLRQLAARDGQLLNVSGLSVDTGINRNKLKELISVIEKTYLLFLLKPFFNNKSKELIKSPKTYLGDLGLKNALLNNFNNLSLRQDKGAILESFVCNSILQQGNKPQFWNELKQHEIDFVLTGQGRTIGIEVKSSLPEIKLTPSISAFIRKHKPDAGIVLNFSKEGELIYENVPVRFMHVLNIQTDNVLDY
ncbi:MAG: ATP-binding protein [Bacteroidales bacterium]|nr:ATP-binding protein [Bacteroidales bacterium]